MSAKAIGELVAPIIAEAIGLARLQEWLDTVDDVSVRKAMVLRWYAAGVLTAEETELLIDHNGLMAA